MSKYKARKLLKELKIEVKRLNAEIEQLSKSKYDNLQLIELIEVQLKPS